jgi:hypothetical protein
MGVMINTYKTFVRKPERKRSLGRSRHRWEDEIKIDLREIGLECEDWILLAQDRCRWLALVNMVVNFRVP